jgi:hypothetical protein
MAANQGERERALAWIASQLRWERTLGRLRGERVDEEPLERKAA